MPSCLLRLPLRSVGAVSRMSWWWWELSTYLWLSGLDNTAGLRLSQHLWLLLSNSGSGLGLRSLLRRRLGCTGLLCSRLLSGGGLGLRSGLGGRLLRRRLLGSSGGRLLWCGFLLLGLRLRGSLGGSWLLLAGAWLGELDCARGTLWLGEGAVLDAGLQGLVDVGSEGIVGCVAQLVVGLNVLLDGLAAVVERSVSWCTSEVSSRVAGSDKHACCDVMR